ncbi:MAG: hemerythrin domain-containing protein [Burkholderiales bacterium]
MQATDILSAEHRVIAQVVAALAAAAARLDAGASVRPGFLADAARFVRDYADGYHHGKEEGVLFVALVEAGMPSHAGPVAVMLAEHDRARALTAALADAAQRYAAGDPAAAADAAASARNYAALLAQHIRKEDGILFPMAAHLLAGDPDGVLLPSYAEVEAAQAGRGTKASLVALASALAAEMEVDPDALADEDEAFVLPCHAG